MNINATLIGQSIAFFVFVWVCMKYIWPPLMRALNERRTKIADGLAAAERGKREQELAEKRAVDTIREAKVQAAEILTQTQRRAGEIIEEAKENARTEGARLLTAANAEIEQEANRARERLRTEVVSIAVAGASKILAREVDAQTHDALLKDLAAQL